MSGAIHDYKFGAILISSWFAIALSGVMLLQAYHYFRGRPKQDHRVFSLLIALLLLLDLAHAVCIMTTVYLYLIDDWGNDNELSRLYPSLALTVGLTGTITFFAQSFFTWRVWKISHGNFIAIIIFICQLARFSCGWVTTVKAITYGTFEAWVEKVRWIFTAGLSMSVVCDILITGSLCYWLVGSRTGFNRGIDAFLDKLILYSVEAGMLTCISAIGSLICGIIMPGNLIFIGIHFVISKLYVNSVLASLNTRNAFRSQKEKHLARPSVFYFSNSSGERDVESARQNTFQLQVASHPGSVKVPVDSTELREAQQISFEVKTEVFDDTFTPRTPTHPYAS